MSPLSRFLLLLLAVSILTSCSHEEPINAPTNSGLALSGNSIDLEQIASEIIQVSGWELDPDKDLSTTTGQFADKSGPPHLRDYEREMLVGNIAHYWWDIPIGPGQYDMIRLHRVVKERRPHKPVHTKKTLFGLHGTPGNFEVMYLSGSVIPSAPDDHSIAVFLAQNGVDVWGIDQAYTLLPAEITDFSFMDGWGLQFDADNLRTGMSVARFVRSFTGSGNGKMNLMGYSTGFMTGFVALNMETQMPRGQRQIGGYIPVDYFYKTLDPEWVAAECAYADDMEIVLQGGVYQHDFGMLFQLIGTLAQDDPEGISPVFDDEETTNMQAALVAGAMTFAMFGFPGEIHFLAGVFEDGFPVDLAFTPLQQYLEWLQGFNNYGSNFLEYDIAVVHCDEEDVIFDDYLDEIEVPVFFVGPRGGFAHLMGYTTTLIGSDDITTLEIQVTPEVLTDFGHVDIFTAVDAEALFWQPVLDWIEDHTRGHGRP